MSLKIWVWLFDINVAAYRECQPLTPNLACGLAFVPVTQALPDLHDDSGRLKQGISLLRLVQPRCNKGATLHHPLAQIPVHSGTGGRQHLGILGLGCTLLVLVSAVQAITWPFDVGSR